MLGLVAFVRMGKVKVNGKRVSGKEFGNTTLPSGDEIEVSDV
jgi:hypothetical protein